MKQNANRVLMIFCNMILLIMSATAQNNPYKIHDALYNDFVRLQSIHRTPEAMPLFDSLYVEAVRLGDTKAQAALLCTPVQRAFITQDFAAMTKAAERLRSVSLKYGYPQYYYYAYTQEITLMIDFKKIGPALAELNKMEADTKRLFNGAGKESCYALYGTFYYSLLNFQRAISYYQKALELSKRLHPHQDNQSLYSSIAECYLQTSQLEKALETIDEGLANIKDKNILYRYFLLLEAKCYNLFLLGRWEEGEVVYQELLTPKYVSFKTQRKTQRIDILHNIHIKNLDHARKLAKEMQDDLVRSNWLSMVEYYAGNLETAYQNQRAAYRLLYTMMGDDRAARFAEMNAEIGNHILQQQNMELDLERSKLALKNTTLELARQRDETEMHRINAANDSLEIANQNLSIARLEASIQQQTVERKLQDQMRQQEAQKNRSRTLLLGALILLLVITIGWGVGYELNRRKSTKQIQRKNEELQEALHNAEESERVKMRFLQNMSHEIRTPLNAIVGFSQILAHMKDGDFSDDQKNEFIDLVDQNTENLTTLIDDILSISALEHGSDLKIVKKPCFINDICKGALASVKMRCPEGVKLYYTTELSDKYSVNSDAQRIRQVVINYLTNAEKATTEGEIHLHASLSENPGMVTISVTDTGIGVPADKAEDIFNRFEKVDVFSQGTGLGLNICRMIADRLGGVVRLDTSHPGPGARFVFIFPVENS